MVQEKGKVRIRRMVDADLPRVNEIDRLLFGEERVSTWPFSFEAYWSVYRPEVSFVADIDGKIAGFAVGTIVPEEHSRSVLNLRHSIDRPSGHRRVGWVDMIGIDPQYQHKGIGQSLIAAFYDECKRNDAIMRGIAEEQDERLRRFLSNAGFKSSGLVLYQKD